MQYKALFVGILLSLNILASDTPRTWVFFDLGNTIIDTSDSSNIVYLENAHEYLLDLREAGYKIGVLSNVPEKWGKTNEEKLKTLKSFIRSRWGDDIEFDWELIDEFYFNPDDNRRKPDPFLFLKALQLANPCSTLFQGETGSEIEAARKAGMAARIVGLEGPGSPITTKSRSFFMPIEEVHKTLKAMPHDKGCFDHINE